MSVPTPALAAWSLWRRELSRFYRERSRVIGALAPPLVFWFLIGSGLGDSFRPAGALAGVDYLRYFFPGTVALVVLFTAVFSTISVIEDRRDGFLQSVLVAPVPRAAMVCGKVAGSATIAFLQGLCFLVLAPAAGLSPGPGGWVLALSTTALLAFALASLGFAIAWKLNSTQGFHAVMNLFLIPMWMLSGALFPLDGAPRWLKVLAAADPLSYGMVLLQGALHGRESWASLAFASGALALFGALTFAYSAWAARGE